MPMSRQLSEEPDNEHKLSAKSFKLHNVMYI